MGATIMAKTKSTATHVATRGGWVHGTWIEEGAEVSLTEAQAKPFLGSILSAIGTTKAAPAKPKAAADGGA